MQERLKGKLLRWDDEKGFGFIVPENNKPQVFIHISAIKNSARRPVVGDSILFRLAVDGNGKTKAVDANIVGVSEIRRKSSNSGKSGILGLLRKIMSLFVISVIAVVIFKKLSNESSLVTNSELATQQDTSENSFYQPTEQPNFQCDGRTHCSQMTSREEAEFFNNNCPNTKMDGDHDGDPCENDSRF